MRRYCFYLIVIFIGMLGHGSCNQAEEAIEETSRINTSHLDHLYQEVTLETGDTVGVIHIYSEYPDYHYVSDDDEGFACVDDAARAGIFYLQHFERTGEPESLRKGLRLLDFILAMQAANGYFYNFLWPDLSIHRQGITTRSEPAWWSWRALWFISEALSVQAVQEDPVAGRLEDARDRLLNSMVADLNGEKTYKDTLGFTIPTWLPDGSATDQAALIVLGLAPAVAKSPDSAITHLFSRMVNGIVDMQIVQTGHWTHGAFLSWENIWHAYGNSQSYALLQAYQATADTVALRAALREIDHFYPELLKKGGLNWFSVKRNDSNELLVEEQAQFDQIAYGIRPVVWACLEAWEITGEERYLDLAESFGKWLTGSNPAGVAMYDATTGRCFDGILGEDKINKNSGAESTIEALLAILALEIAGVELQQ